jgi:hypothetical protein
MGLEGEAAKGTEEGNEKEGGDREKVQLKKGTGREKARESELSGSLMIC